MLVESEREKYLECVNGNTNRKEIVNIMQRLNEEIDEMEHTTK